MSPESRRPPRYLGALLEHVRRAGGVEPGRVVHVEVRHDDGCAHWRGRPCDCSPEIETGARVERKHRGGE